jgi:death-on-curing protein
MEIKTLSVAEVLKVHEILVRDFAESPNPVQPPGVRSDALLASAVGRQLTSLGNVLKYPEPYSNAATLAYGICCDHAFHNGNKRTALVSMLAHLDRNQLTLYDTNQNDLYDLMTGIADHSFAAKHDKKLRGKPKVTADDEVQAITQWLRERADRIRRGERIITFRELRSILKGFGFHLENPKDNKIDIVRHETETSGLFLKRKRQVVKRIGSMSWPGENREVGIAEVKRVRAICKLREEDGTDSTSFYEYTIIVDSFVNRYRSVLRRLARL